MKITNLGFSLIEKFAIVQAVDAVIVADGKIHKGEINALAQLMRRIDFETNFILQARNMSLDQGQSILNEMSFQKKISIANILNEIAISDGFVHEKESTLITSILEHIGIDEKARAAK